MKPKKKKFKPKESKIERKQRLEGKNLVTKVKPSAKEYKRNTKFTSEF
jgi:hypothetical protein